jgi:hypothetical protein
MSQTPVIGGDFAAGSAPAPVDAPPAAAPVVDHAVLAAAIVSALQQSGAAAAPAATGSATAATTAPATTAATTAAPAPVDAAAAPATYKPGDVALYQVSHLGREHYQAMLVLDTYTATDAKGQAVPKLRLLPLGRAHEHAELPADQVIPASAFDWEHAA